jgi:hypothetical protein
VKRRVRTSRRALRFQVPTRPRRTPRAHGASSHQNPPNRAAESDRNTSLRALRDTCRCARRPAVTTDAMASLASQLAVPAAARVARARRAARVVSTRSRVVAPASGTSPETDSAPTVAASAASPTASPPPAASPVAPPSPSPPSPAAEDYDALERQALVRRLLGLAAATSRGQQADRDSRAVIEDVLVELEFLNPTTEPARAGRRRVVPGVRQRRGVPLVTVLLGLPEDRPLGARTSRKGCSSSRRVSPSPGRAVLSAKSNRRFRSNQTSSSAKWR